MTKGEGDQKLMTSFMNGPLLSRRHTFEFIYVSVGAIQSSKLKLPFNMRSRQSSAKCNSLLDKSIKVIKNQKCPLFSKSYCQMLIKTRLFSIKNCPYLYALSFLKPYYVLTWTSYANSSKILSRFKSAKYTKKKPCIFPSKRNFKKGRGLLG